MLPAALVVCGSQRLVNNRHLSPRTEASSLERDRCLNGIAPYAGTFTEASTSNRTTIKAINALVTWPAMGAGFFASHLHVTPFFRCIGGNQPARRYRRSSAKVLAWV
jgi:hypothetical protein